MSKQKSAQVWDYLRLCTSCADKFRAAGYELEEILNEPTKRCRCAMGWDGHGGQLCLYRKKRRAYYGE